MIRDWDDAYENSAYIAGAEALPAVWAARAAAYRAALGTGVESLAYGSDPRHALDLIRPEGTPRGLAVFIHGGYWVACSKEDWTHLAHGLLARGYAVAIPSYRLAPTARLSQIAADVAAAITLAARHITGPIRLCGHSAGGHLAARLVATDSPLADEVIARIARVVPVSGLFDLRPLARTAYAEDLRLDGATCAAESPVMRLPHPAYAGAMDIAVGAAERPEFLRQSRMMALGWEPFVQMSLTEIAGADHFSILDGLGDPASALVGLIAS